MKAVKIISFLVFFSFLLFGIWACDNDDDSDASDSGDNPADDDDDDNNDDDNDDNDDDNDDDDSCVPAFPDLRVCAHRGARFLAPENTLPAIETAFEFGAWAAEVDVRHTSDGHYVLMHDDTVNRTTNGNGLVEEMTLSEIRGLTVDDWMFGNIHEDLVVPTLEEALALAKQYDRHLDLDMKTDQVEGAIQVVVDEGAEDLCFVYSSNPTKLERVRSVSGDVAIQPATSSVTETQALLDQFDPDPEHIELTSEGFTPANVALIEANGIVVFMDALGVRDVLFMLGFENAWFSMMDGGVDIMQTDFPGKLIEYRDSLCE